MPELTIFYKIPENCPDSFYEIKTGWSADIYLGYIADDCAEDYFENQEGYEDQWPIVFELYKEKEGECGELLGKYEIALEQRPTFYACKL